MDKKGRDMKTGTIRMIQPKGGYNSQYGHVNTFMMTIDVPGEGQITGEIGSKTTPYPLKVNDQISFEMKNTEHGWKFKKVDPQYNQSSQGKTKQRDYDAENRGKCRLNIIKAAIIAGGLNCTCYEHVIELTEFAMTGIIPQYSQQPSVPQQGDDVPF